VRRRCHPFALFDFPSFTSPGRPGQSMLKVAPHEQCSQENRENQSTNGNESRNKSVILSEPGESKDLQKEQRSNCLGRSFDSARGLAQDDIYSRMRRRSEVQNPRKKKTQRRGGAGPQRYFLGHRNERRAQCDGKLKTKN
jgi:hypothetical protein